MFDRFSLQKKYTFLQRVLDKWLECVSVPVDKHFLCHTRLNKGKLYSHCFVILSAVCLH